MFGDSSSRRLQSLHLRNAGGARTKARRRQVNVNVKGERSKDDHTLSKDADKLCAVPSLIWAPDTLPKSSDVTRAQ